MISSGFFDSINSDRTYSAESFNTFFEGLISKNGIFENVDGCFAVTTASGLTVNVATGKALVNSRWVKSDAIETITVDTPHNLFNRYDAIVLRWSNTTRDITLEKITGTSNSTPTKPVPTRDSSTYEIVLAYIYVKANATSLMPADIIDCRYDSDLCGLVTGLIEQVNITNLYNQFAAQFHKLSEQMEVWQQEQQAAYNEWFTTLTSELKVETELQRTIANHKTIRTDGTQYIDVPSSLDYKAGDILDVFVNGILMVEGTDYDLMTNEVENVPMVYFYSDIEIDNIVTFYCLKSVVGDTVALAQVESALDEVIAIQNEILGE